MIHQRAKLQESCWCVHVADAHVVRDGKPRCVSCERFRARYFVAHHSFRPISTLPLPPSILFAKR
jgi:hypothetical protein